MERIIGTSKVSRAYQVTLLEDVREILGIEKEGEKIVYLEKDGEVIIRKV